MTDPVTPREWQYCVDAASFLLTLASARDYGLISGGPRVNIERCAEMLRRGEAAGYLPRDIDILTREFLAWQRAEAQHYGRH